jgi:hypothetical protein
MDRSAVAMPMSSSGGSACEIGVPIVRTTFAQKTSQSAVLARYQIYAALIATLDWWRSRRRAPTAGHGCA